MARFGAIVIAIRIANCKFKMIFQPASCLEKLLEGLLRRSGGFGQKFPEGGLDFLEVALVWKSPYGILPKQTSKKFASEPPEILRSPSRSGRFERGFKPQQFARFVNFESAI